MKQIIFRADDAGSTEGANVAVAKTVTDGVVRNVSVMAPGLAFDHAIPILKDLGDICLGVHLTLSAEWERVKWKPLTDSPTLKDDNGFFTTAPTVLNERGYAIDEAITEAKAQIDRCRSAGLKVEYFDEHMGVGWIRGLRSELEALCERERLIYYAAFPWLEGTNTQDIPSLLNAIADVSEGTYVVVGHPGSDIDPVMRDFTLPGMQPGEILRQRAQDRRVLCDPRLLDARHHGAFQSISYADAWHSMAMDGV